MPQSREESGGAPWVSEGCSREREQQTQRPGVVGEILVVVRVATWARGCSAHQEPDGRSCGRWEPQEAVSRKQCGQTDGLRSSHREWVTGGRWYSPPGPQAQWLDLSLAKGREDVGGREGGSPQASGVGPHWVGVLMSGWSQWGHPRRPAESSTRQGQSLSPRPLAPPSARGCSVLSGHQWGLVFRWRRHLCCCHKREVVLSCCSAQTPRCPEVGPHSGSLQWAATG